MTWLERSAIRHDEVVFIPEPVRLPAQRRIDRQPDIVPLAVEDDGALDGGRLRVVDRNVLQPEFARLARLQHEVKFGKALIGQPEVAHQIDRTLGRSPDNAQRLARHGHLRAREPETDAAFDMYVRRWPDR
jgi:hypothetical protein